MTHDFDWLIASLPAGSLCSATAANNEAVAAGFIRAHQLDGHRVERLTFEQARERFRTAVAPARERYYQEQPRLLGERA